METFLRGLFVAAVLAAIFSVSSSSLSFGKGTEVHKIPNDCTYPGCHSENKCPKTDGEGYLGDNCKEHRAGESCVCGSN